MNKLLKAFKRTKHLTSRDVEETPLHRVLSTFDLTALGVGSTLGAGVYVVTGEVAKLKAGPAIVISFTIAAIASILSGLCYAEFGVRVPRAGSAYIYSYVTVGELCAFVIGWNLVLEYIVGASSVARAWSGFFDSLLQHRIQNFTLAHVGHMNVPALSEYPDFLAFGFVCVVTVILISGIEQSAMANWFFTTLNIIVIAFAIIAGFVFAEPANWQDFMPFGFYGVVSGAATCFYCFVGFDAIATSAEEAKTPSKSIPIAIVASLLICYVAYLCVSAALTLMTPYYALDETAALAIAFETKGFMVGKYIVATGAMCGLSASAMMGSYSLSRIVYAMASDGVIFKVLAKVSQRTGTPVIACIVSGLLIGLLALLLDLVALVEMLSIGTLLAYTMVAFCVTLLRYKPGSDGVVVPSEKSTPRNDPGGDTDGVEQASDDTAGRKSLNAEKRTPEVTPSWLSGFARKLTGMDSKVPTLETYRCVKILLAIFIVLSAALQNCIIYGHAYLLAKDPFLIILLVLLVVGTLVVTELIGQQPQSKNELPFKVPLVPVVPLLAIFIDMTLIFMLSYLTWIRFVVWMTIGMSIYLFYGVKNSEENEARSHDEYMYLSATQSDDENKLR